MNEAKKRRITRYLQAHPGWVSLADIIRAVNLTTQETTQLLKGMDDVEHRNLRNSHRSSEYRYAEAAE